MRKYRCPKCSRLLFVGTIQDAEFQIMCARRSCQKLLTFQIKNSVVISPPPKYGVVGVQIVQNTI